MGGTGGGCPTGFADCDSNPSDCETALNLLTSCGSCNTFCDPTHGNVICNPQSLTCEVISCSSGWGNCDANAGTGCETDTQVAPLHCGTCGQSCQGSTCTTGLCDEVILSDGASGGHQYALTSDAMWDVQCNASPCSAYTVRKYPKDGSPAQIMDQASFPSGGLVADGDDVYIGAQGNPTAVFEIPAGGVKTLAFSTTKNISRLGIAGNKLTFWTSGGEVGHVEKDGSQLTTLATGQPSVFHFASSPTNAYWVSFSGSTWTLRTVSLSGGSVTDLATVASAVQLAAHGPYVYWVVRSGTPLDGISRHSPAGGTEVLLQGQQIQTFGTDGTSLWYVLYNGGNSVELFRRPIGSSASTKIAQLLAVGPIFGVDATHVYYAGNFSKAMKVAK
jgi:hypothetical protein